MTSSDKDNSLDYVGESNIIKGVPSKRRQTSSSQRKHVRTEVWAVRREEVTARSVAGFEDGERGYKARDIGGF